VLVIAEQFVAHASLDRTRRGWHPGRAFADRLGEVDGWPGFQRLEVWRDEAIPGRYIMVSWWDDRESFKRYMRSDSHRRSHARIPDDPVRPRAVSFSRFTVVAR
jgi:heme-degrading monooxygenase HmoA